MKEYYICSNGLDEYKFETKKERDTFTEGITLLNKAIDIFQSLNFSVNLGPCFDIEGSDEFYFRERED